MYVVPVHEEFHVEIDSFGVYGIAYLNVVSFR